MAAKLKAAILIMLLTMIWTFPLHADVVIRDSAGQKVGLYKNNYALVIGVSDYTNGWPDLPGVRKEVAPLRTVLEKHGFDVTVVEDPDSDALRKAYRDFINEHGRNKDDRLLLYFSGHGHTLKKGYGGDMGYIVPADAPNPDIDLKGFQAKAVSMQTIEDYARDIDSKHALFLFDSCFSGSLFNITRAIPKNISYKTAKPVRQFITAGDADEQVPDPSIFFEQFVAALNGEADQDSDGYITGTELGEFLQKQVINYSNNTQHPQYGKIRDPFLDKGDFVFQLPVATVTIKSSPSDAIIYVDGVELKKQKTPATLKLSIGEHRIAVMKSPSHRRSEPQTFKLQPGVNQDIMVRLEQKMGTLDISSTPSGASIRINENDELEPRITPAKLMKPPGKYIVTVQREDRDPYTTVANLADGQILKLQVSLPEQTQLYVTSKPSGCRIDLGKLGIHKTPALLRGVKPGDYKASGAVRGCSSRTQKFTVAPHIRNMLEIQLFPVSRVQMAWRSLLLPGWGQYYGGRYSSGTTFLLAGIGAAAGATTGYLLYSNAVDDYDRSILRYNDAFEPHEFESAKKAMIDAHDEADSRFTLRQSMFITAGLVWGANMAQVLISGPVEMPEEPQTELSRWQITPQALPNSMRVILARRF